MKVKKLWEFHPMKPFKNNAQNVKNYKKSWSMFKKSVIKCILKLWKLKSKI